MRNRDPACSFTVSPPWSWHFFLVWLLLCNFHSPSVEDRYIFSMVGTESGWTCRFKSNKSMDSKQASKNKSEHCRHSILQEHVGAHRCNYLIILFTSIFHHFFDFPIFYLFVNSFCNSTYVFHLFSTSFPKRFAGTEASQLQTWRGDKIFSNLCGLRKICLKKLSFFWEQFRTHFL